MAQAADLSDGLKHALRAWPAGPDKDALMNLCLDMKSDANLAFEMHHGDLKKLKQFLESRAARNQSKAEKRAQRLENGVQSLLRVLCRW